MEPLLSKKSFKALQGFSILELLVSVAVFITLLVIIVSVITSLSTTMRRATSNVDAQASARIAFDVTSRSLSQATLNPYWDYDNPLAPTVYLRQSDLQFIIRPNSQNSAYGQEVYFVAPQEVANSSDLRSTRSLLNACSTFVKFGPSSDFQPDLLPESTAKYRYRLMLGIQPTEGLQIFNKPKRSDSSSEATYRTALQDYWNSAAWISELTPTNKAHIAPLADNIIAFISWPRLPTGEDPDGTQLLPSSGKFAYNSQSNTFATPQPLTANQLPPLIQTTLISISEASAARLENGSTPPALIEGILAGRFTKADDYATDLAYVTGELDKNQIEYHVFTTSVPLQESKWSRAQ